MTALFIIPRMRNQILKKHCAKNVRISKLNSIVRIEQLTITRFVAAILIVIFHFGRKLFPFNNGTYSFLFCHADVGVSYFFILSGFVMIIAYSNRSSINTFEYLKNRFARIYPVYFLAIVLLFINNIKTKTTVDLYDLLLSVFTLQAWVPGETLCFNFPGWSIGTEFFFYISFPFLFNFVYKKSDFRSLVIPISLFWIVSQIVFHFAIYSPLYHGYPSRSHDLLFFFPLMHLNAFLIGNLIGFFFINDLKGKSGNYDWLIAILLVLIIVALKNHHGLNFHNGLLSLLFVPLILLLSLNNGVLASISKWNFLVFLGEVSYGIYILQYPILLWSRDLFFSLHITNPVAKFHIFLFLLITSASISYLFFETPLRELIKSIPIPAKRKNIGFHKIPTNPTSATSKAFQVGDRTATQSINA